jgi:hypothetical protein
MRNTFVFDIAGVISLDDLSDFESTVASQLVQGRYNEVFATYTHKPAPHTPIDLQYQKLTQYIAKLVINKELNEDKYPEVYDKNIIQVAFKNAPLDDVLQVLNLLKEIPAYEHAKAIRSEILKAVCEAPSFYQQTQDQFLYPTAISNQIIKFYNEIKDDKELIERFNINIKQTYAQVADDYKSRHALVQGVLKVWETSQQSINQNDIAWLREITLNLKNEYQQIPTILQKIFTHCRNAIEMLVQNPLTTLGFSGLIGFIFIPNFLVAYNYTQYTHGFINKLKEITAKHPRPFDERTAKALEGNLQKLYTLARLNHIDIAHLDREAEENEQLQANINATPFILVGTVVFLSLTLLGHIKNAPTPIPLPEWVYTLERSLDSSHSNQYKI